MAQKLLTSLLILYFGLPFENLSQKIIDIKADLIQLDENGFRLYKESISGDYYEIELDLNRLYDFEYRLELYSDLIDSAKISDTAIPVTALQNISQEELESINSHIYYEYEPNFIQQLSYFNSGFFTLRNYRLEQSSYDSKKDQNWSRQDTYYYNYFVLRINQDKQLYVLVEHDSYYSSADIEGIFGKTGSGFVGILNGDFFKHGNEKTYSIEKSLIQNYSYDNPPEEKYRITESNKLKENVFDEVLISEDYDSLYIENGFIIGLKNNQYDIYNYKLNKISPPKTRGVHTHADYDCQVLIGNQIRWLKKSGELLKKREPKTFMVCGTVTTVEKELSLPNDSIKIIKRIDHFDGKEPILSSFMFKNLNYSDIWFLNGAKTVSYDGNSGINATYDIPGEEYKLLIVKDKGKYGLVEYESMDEKVMLKEIVSPQYDSIIFKNYYHPILLKKDNLYGYHKLNEKLRYKSISAFDKSFARFTLPSGKKGWLDIKGREYMDK